METDKLIEALRAECEGCSERGVSDNKCHSLYYCPNREAADRLEAMMAQLGSKDKQLAAAESRMNKAFTIANNAIYFADSSDYHSALCDCGVALFPEVDEYDIGREFIESGPQVAGEGGG